MDSPTYLMGILGFMALLLAAIVAILLNRLSGRTIIRVEARPLLTARERDVLVLIERAVPHARVYVQVAMGALLRPVTGQSRFDWAGARNRFSREIVDFVIEDRESGAVLALVELDDGSHDAALDAQRDAMTIAAGYRTLRLPAGRLTKAEIIASLDEVMSITVPSAAAESVVITG